MRRRNLRAPGAPGYLGQTVAPSERLAEMLDAAAASPLWRAAAGDAPAGSLVGVGMALNHQGEGLGTLPPDAGAVRLRLAPDGAIEALYGLDEIGQGLVPAIRSCVSAALGCAREDVRPIFGDTAAAPDSGSTTAARGIYVIWKGVDLAGPAFSDRLRAAAAKALGLSADEIAIVPGGVARRGANSGAMLARFRDLADRLAPEALPEAEAAYPFPKSDYVAGNARFLFSSGATLARVAIDRATGRVRVLDLELHTACGPVIDLASYLGQIEGGAVQGLGFTLSEDLPMRGGAPLALNLDGYMLPSILDAPARIACHALEDLDPGDPYGPRGAGEIGIGAVTPAIANAVADALGVAPAVTPFPPAAMLAALRAAEAAP
jgi:CO/xanthine dehydrogenase Mo-binding subunit